MLTAGLKWMNNNYVLKKIWGRLGPIFFPQRCPVCDDLLAPEEVKKGIHEVCKKKLHIVQGSTCMHCGRPLTNASEEYCLECQRKKYVAARNPAKSAQTPCLQSKSYITQGKALYLYRGAIKKAMYRFKYSNRREYADYFAREAIRIYGSWLQQRNIDVIVPVPMYKGKKRKRGYNQAEVFARALSDYSNIPINAGMVHRIKNTVPQKELNDIERKNNLKNAFQIEKNIVQYRHVLVVDDIYTTGSTAEAVAEEMIKIGVSQVYAFSICIGKDM